jgi:hypothetical protein
MIIAQPRGNVVLIISNKNHQDASLIENEKVHFRIFGLIASSLINC